MVRVEFVTSYKVSLSGLFFNFIRLGWEKIQTGAMAGGLDQLSSAVLGSHHLPPYAGPIWNYIIIYVEVRIVDRHIKA